MFYNIKCNKSACLTVFSANGSPINVRFSQRFQLSPQDLVLRQHAMWICIHHRLRYFTDILQQLSVTGYIGNLQIESNAALLCPFQISRTT